MMPTEGEEDNAAASLTLLNVEHRRTTEEDRIDLDYDEDVSNDVPCDEKKVEETPEEPSADVKEEAVDDEKEEGELEEGELSSSDDEPTAVDNASKSTSAVSISSASNNKGINSRLTKVSNGKAGESAWERGLREAREAMRRASKVREEPDFEVKRLVAAGAIRRSSRNNTDSDNSMSPAPHRGNHSRSGSPRGIPSLLDLKTLPPPRRVPPKECVKRRSDRHLRPITRPSPSYSPTSEHSRPIFEHSRSIFPRINKYLGPQVIYPNGRPYPKRENERDDRDRRDRGRRREKTPPPRRDREIQPRRKDTREKSKSNNDSSKIRKISLSISPISSDSDLSPDTRKKPLKGSKNDLAEVNDPWARKKKGKNDKFDRKRRSSSSSSSASSNSSRSTFTGKRKGVRSSSTSSSSSDSDTDKRKKHRKNSSPRRSGSKASASKKKPAVTNPVDEFFTKKKSDLPAAFQKRARKRSSSVSGNEKGFVAVSGTESDRSLSTVSSAESSPARSPSPKLYPKRAREKSPSPISDDSKGSSPRPPPPPKLEDISPPPSSSPPVKKLKMSKDNRLNEKRKLMEQLREVEGELEKRRAAQMETAH